MSPHLKLCQIAIPKFFVRLMPDLLTCSAMKPINNLFKTPQGDFKLVRFPQHKKETLRAWDAADEYLLQYLEAEGKTSTNNAPRILIVNDSFGALAMALQTFKPDVQLDSCLAEQGLINNFQLNNIDLVNITLLNSMMPLNGYYDLVIIKLPKSHAYLEDILYKIQPHINPQSKIIAAAMAKNIHSSTLKLFEKIIGKTTTSLAKKKARLIFSSFTNNKVTNSPYPKQFELEVEDNTFLITNYANVFSREKLDIGTRFLLENMPQPKPYKAIVDLGCGNGLLGLVAAQQNPEARVIFTDESYMAVASAKINVENAFGTSRTAEFLVKDCLAGVEKQSVDLILCNPPFHQNHVVGDHIAWQMFNEAYAALEPGGEFWIVGNHHLAYHSKLKKIFGDYNVVASNKKFAVMLSRKA